MTTYYKAVRPDGGSFNDPSFMWATEPGGVTTHPLWRTRGRDETTAAGYLSVATVATDCTGMLWPCRLLLVEPVGRLWTPDAVALPNKRAGLRFRTVRELPAHEALGPQGEHVAALIDRASLLTSANVRRLAAARAATGAAARDAAGDAAWAAAWAAAWDAAWAAARGTAWAADRAADRAAAWDAAWGLAVRDLIGSQHYDALTLPWRATVGRIHPDDPDVTP